MRHNDISPSVALVEINELLKEIVYLRTLKGVNNIEVMEWKDKVCIVLPKVFDYCGYNCNQLYIIPGLINGIISTKKEYTAFLH